MTHELTLEKTIRDSFAVQAHWCTKLGSPFTAHLLECLGKSLDQKSKTGRTILNWTGRPDAMGDAVALRLAGALHGLVRAGRLPELAQYYPPNRPPSKNVLTGAAMAAIAVADEEICQWLAFAPQTNEVARSGILYPGMRLIAGETGLPLSLFELGASAGLNLIPDRFAYRLGTEEFGQAASTVTLEPNWTGSAPEGNEPEIMSRRGCDMNPLDISIPAQRARLIAYIWADQAERLARAEAACDLALTDLPVVEKSDAADWVETMIDREAMRGVTRVLFHSIAWQYFPEDVKQRIERRMVVAGALATPEAPLAWLTFEQLEGHGACLSLRLWRGDDSRDGEVRILARANNAHVGAVEWLGLN